MTNCRLFDGITRGAGETRALGRALGRQLRAGDVVLLNGDLGAGKTTFAQGIAEGMGIPDLVQSPTFTLVAEHESEATGIRLYHLDLYRLDGPEELESFGFEQYLVPTDGVSVIEWPERAGDWLPDCYLLVDFGFAGADERRVVIESCGEFAINDLNASAGSSTRLAP